MGLIDQANELAELHLQHALKQIPRQAGLGAEFCSYFDCLEPISPERQRLGAIFCLDCQRENELKAKHLRGRGR